MAISTLAGLRAAYDAGQRVSWHKEPVAFPFLGNAHIGGFGHIWDYWQATGYPAAGINPGTFAGNLYSKASQGAQPLSTTAGSTYVLADVQPTATWLPAQNPSLDPLWANSEWHLHVWDRVWANGGLPLNSTSRQSWVPPALTRYTSGLGLSLWLRMYTIQATASSTVTIEYVNSDGVSRTFASTQLFNTNYVYYPYVAVPMPLQLGDRGIRSITAVTLSASTAGAGTYGFMIAKYLGAYRCNSTTQPEASAPVSPLSALPQFDGDACLTFGVQVGANHNPTTNTLVTAGTMPRVALEAKVVTI